MIIACSCSTAPRCYASENIVDSIKEQSSENEELEKNFYEIMEKNAEKNFERFQNIEVSQDISAQEILDNLDNWLQRIIAKTLLFIHTAKGAISILIFVAGAFYALLFKRDKVRIKAGIKLAILSILIYIVALFLPAVLEAILF